MKRALPVVAIVIAAAVAWWWSGSRHDASTRVDPETALDGEAPDRERDDRPVPPRAAAPGAMRGSVSLPPPGTAPAAVVSALLAAADAGDTRAACRVAIELATCNYTQELSRTLSTPDELADVFGADYARDMQPQHDAMLAHLRQCEAVPAAVRARAASLLRAAALAGEPDAAMAYASGGHLGGTGTHGFIARPGFDRWRAEAVPLLWRLFRAGDRRALFELESGSGNGFAPVHGLVRDDPETARALQLLGSRLDGEDDPGDRRLSDPAAERRASERATAWQRDHFRGPSVPVTGVGPMALVMPPWLGGVERERCAGDRAW